MEAKHLKQDIREDDNAFIQAIPAVVFAVILAYVYLNIGTFMNGEIGSQLTDDLAPTATDNKTSMARAAVGTIDNLTGYYDSNINMVKIAITISVLLVPLMAVMTLRRYV